MTLNSLSAPLARIKSLWTKWTAPRRLARSLDRIYGLGQAAAAARSTRQADGTWLTLVVPVYNAPATFLDDLLKSFCEQQVPGTELIFCDDGSSFAETLDWLRDHEMHEGVTVIRGKQNAGISSASNLGIRAARGDWISFVDHDDLIAPHALGMIRETLDQSPGIQFLYTDEVLVGEDLKPVVHMKKPAYDPVLLSGVNYINHFSVYRRSRLIECGLLRSEFDGSQDYDLLLRYLDGLKDDDVLHLPYPCYWWRLTKGSYSKKYLQKATANARKALNEHYKREVVPALHEDLHRVDFGGHDDHDGKVSIIIPNRNSFDLINRLLDDLYEWTDYPDFEVIVVDNGTSDEQVLSLYEEFERRHSNFTASVTEEPFNFSRSVNRGFKLAQGKHFLLLNNDVEVIEKNWLRELVACLNYPGAGIVGAKLLFANDTIQHAGVIVGASGLASHWYYKKPAGFTGPLNRLCVRNGVVCVTGAVMLISGTCKDAVGDFDEDNFKVAYNDVDFCLRAHKAGFRTIWTPFACLYHHESLSRGSDKKPENQARFNTEKQNLRRIHATSEFSDPAVSPYDKRIGNRQTVYDGLELSPARRWYR